MKGHQTYKTVQIIVPCHVLNPTHEKTQWESLQVDYYKH